MTSNAIRVQVAAVLLSCWWTGATYAQTQLDDIEGAWEGTVSISGAGTGNVPRRLLTDREFRLRVKISGDGAKVSVSGSESLELGGGRMARLGASAIIFGVTGTDVAATDNWAITVTKRDQDSLLVFVSRVFNGGAHGTELADTFAIGGFGELQKVADD
jgi:hypothetical protein